MSLDCKENKTLSKISKILLPVLALCWMMVIFWFSAAPAPESSEMSYTVGLQIGKIAVADFDAWTTEEQNAFAEKIEYPIRKMAHATEYAILGMLVSGTAYAYGICGKKAIRYAWIWATFYAATDEFHQLFVPGRSGQIPGCDTGQRRSCGWNPDIVQSWQSAAESCEKKVKQLFIYRGMCYNETCKNDGSI